MNRRQTFRRLLSFVRPYRRELVWALFAATGVAIVLPTIPLFIRRAVDSAIPSGDQTEIFVLVGGLLAVAIIKAWLHGVRRMRAGIISIGVEADMRREIYDHVVALDVAFHERVSTGQIMSRATSDINAIRQYLMSLAWSLTLVVQVVAIFAIMFILSPLLAGLFLATAPFMGVYTYRFADKFDPVVLRMQQNLAELASVVEETVVGIRVVKAFGREGGQVNKLTVDADGVYDAAMESIELRARFVPLFNFIPQLGLVAVLYVGGRQVIDGSLTAGTLLALFSYLFMLIWPLRAIGMIVAWGQRATTAAGRVFEILDTDPHITDTTGARELAISDSAVAFRNVHFTYPDGNPVLRGLDLGVPAGSSMALVGHTGCGKSTLLHLLPRFIEPTDGSISIDGQDVANATLESLRDGIGIVFENTLLFSDSIAANIAFGRPDATPADIERAAHIAQAHTFITELPDGYDTVVGEQGYTLSGGQRQRVAIARAILIDPKILILDDATSNVDAQVEAAIRKGLREAMVGRTTLIVARRPQTAALADRVAYLEHGKVTAVGTHQDMWENNADYRNTLLTSENVDAVAGEIETVS